MSGTLNWRVFPVVRRSGTQLMGRNEKTNFFPRVLRGDPRVMMRQNRSGPSLTRNLCSGSSDFANTGAVVAKIGFQKNVSASIAHWLECSQVFFSEWFRTTIRQTIPAA